ncbi:MAG TPA: hypothetical protein VEK11_07350 [Thermoanaerobaculia bacterium]|nr:hypothetical protein [Thermoanaerobaculia bacterium]
MLYFGMIQLLLVDASRDLAEARRFRARVIAWTLAENAAERSAYSIATLGPASMPTLTVEDEHGIMRGQLMKPGKNFRLVGEGESKGVVKVTSTVTVIGRVEDDGTVYIDFTMHSN